MHCCWNQVQYSQLIGMRVRMRVLFILLVAILATAVLPISSTCTDGTCKETRDMDLGDDERVEDRYLRRSNELLARFSKDKSAEKREEGSVADLGERIRALEDIQRMFLEASDRDDRAEQRRLRDQLLTASEVLCEELSTKRPLRSECDSGDRYRSHDGSCNNLKYPARGKAVHPLQRILQPDYEDGVSEFCGSNRPSTRAVTVAVAGTHTGIDEDYNPINPTELVMHYGQFVDHDLVHVPTEIVDCVGCEETEVCCPIAVADDDPVFSSLECLQFKRSRPTLSADCDPRTRDQENQITSYLDSSNVYGSSDAESDELRDKTKGTGQMKVNEEPISLEHLPILPPDETNPDCTVGADLSHCGKGGDIRAAEQPGLTGIHTILVREHNRIAIRLHELNSAWTDEQLYQESRRIVNAIYQHITYNEFLPILLGWQLMNDHHLPVGNPLLYSSYNQERDATITNSFATAAFRQGHSFVPNVLKRVNSKYQEVYPEIPLREAFFNGTYVHDFENGGVDAILLGMIHERLLKIDRLFSEGILSFLFAEEHANFGMDLVSLNIQRGRDHGLPSYGEFFEFCHGNQLRSFNDLRFTNRESSRRLRSVYRRVQDIDAFVGMVTEEPVAGAAMGPTAGCIIAAQFEALKYGDRFWYENQVGPQRFTVDQLVEIRKSTYARLLCDNLAEVDQVQPYAFMMPSARPRPSRSRSFVDYSRNGRYPVSNDRNDPLPGFNNARVRCSDTVAIPIVDLEPWRE